MSVTDLVFIDSTGYNYQDFPAFLAFYTTGYQNIYGVDVYLGSDSQDGQWVSLQAQAAYDTAANGAATYNSFAPPTAQGTGLSRLVLLNGIQRENSSNSTVELTIVGVAFTPINNGIAIDVLQQQWALPISVTIPNSGTITVTAVAVVEGALQALPDTITNIFTPTQGWQTVNNAAAATPGAPVEPDAQLRLRQAQSTALPSQTVLEGTFAAVANVPGVIAVQDYENYTNTTDANGLPPHSISFVVEGGTDTDVAQAMQIKKTPGTDTYGTTSVPTTDSNGVPITINFFRPTNAVISIQVTLTPLASWIESNETIIAAALATYINTMIKIGGDIVLTQLYGIAYVPTSTAAGSFNIEGIELKKNSGSFSASDIQLLFNEDAVCDAATNVTFVL